MNVSELKVGQGKVDIELKIKSKGDVRSFNKYGRDLKVCNFVATDEAGDIKLTLWNDDIDKVNVGNTVKITNGYVNDFNGEKQLTPGKYGKLEIVDGKEWAKESKEGEAEEPKEKKKAKKDKEEIKDIEF